MKKSNVKNNLDEMQEQKLLRIEHNGCWFAFWALFISLTVQNIIYNDVDQMQYVIGEWIVFMCLSLYIGIACIRNGIWDRRLKANPTTNLLMSLAGGVVMAVIMFIMAYKRSGMIGGSIFAGVFAGGFIFVLCFLVLTFSAAMYQKRLNKMEAEDPENE